MSSLADLTGSVFLEWSREPFMCAFHDGCVLDSTDFVHESKLIPLSLSHANVVADGDDHF